jgi:hypothetical protein
MELEKTLAELSVTVKGFQSDIEESRPLLFDDFAQGSKLERDTIIVRYSNFREI